VPEIWLHGAKLAFNHAELKQAAQAWLTEARCYHPDFQIINAGDSLFPVSGGACRPNDDAEQ
jgi:hypothetical protein